MKCCLITITAAIQENGLARARIHEDVLCEICVTGFLNFSLWDCTSACAAVARMHSGSLRAPSGTGDVKDLVRHGELEGVIKASWRAERAGTPIQAFDACQMDSSARRG